MHNSGTGGTDAGLGSVCKLSYEELDTGAANPLPSGGGCNKQSHDVKWESRNNLDRHSQLTSERKLEFYRRST